MWLRSEKRSSRIAQPKNKSTIQLRKIIKNTPALKNLKQTTSTVTPNRRGGVYSSTPGIANSGGKTFRNNGDAKQSSSSSIKCNIKSRTSVKRLAKKSGNAFSKKNKRKNMKAIDKHQCGRIRRRSLRNISEIGKENCWQDQAQLELYTSIESKRGRKTRAGVSCGSANPADGLDSAGNKDNVKTAVDTLGNFSLSNDACDSCKPSTTCNCSSSSSQTDQSQSTCELNASKNVCVNYIECDSTTDNDQANLPSTSMLVTVRFGR